MSEATNADTETVHHYTSAQGLLGILGNHEIWLSDADFLNDGREINYAADLIAERLRSKLDAMGSPDSPVGKGIQRLLKVTGGGAQQTQWRTSSYELTPFVASFCTSGDLLSMWRSYAGATGFSVEFDTKLVEDSMIQNNVLGGRFVPVTYGAGELETVVDQLIRMLEAEPNESWINPSFEELKVLVTACASTKHEAFSEEKEVRLLGFPVHHNSDLPELRSGAGHLVPFHKVGFPAEAIRSITVGPSTHRARSASALRKRLHGSQKGFGYLPIRESTAPLVV